MKSKPEKTNPIKSEPAKAHASKSPMIFALIPQIMSELGPIGKDNKNTAQNYKFRGIDQMYNHIQPVMVKHGVFCAPQVIKTESQDFANAEGKVKFRVIHTVNHRFYAEDGSFVEVVTVGEGIDNSDKASNKAMSSAMKYAFIELFSIPTEDVADSDKDSPEVDTDPNAPLPSKRGFELKNVNHGFGL